MDKNNMIVFDIIKASLFNCNVEIINDADWNQLLQEFKAHAIVGLPYEWIINNMSLDKTIMREWTHLTMLQVSHWTKIMEAQKSLIQLMENHGIEMVVIKGATAAMDYFNPMYRSMGDIDFIVKQDRYIEAYQLMLEHGYVGEVDIQTLQGELEDDIHFHVELKKYGIVFELHRRMPWMQANEKQEYIQALLDEGLKNIEYHTIENYQIPTFPMPIHGFILLRHIIQHLVGNGIGLRQILDWAVFVDKHLDDDMWENEFSSIVKDTGLDKTAIIVTRMCQLYLGLREDKITWCKDADIKVCDELINYIFRFGNFGRKAGDKEHGVWVFTKINKNFFVFIKSLQKYGCENWNLLKRHSCLRPFAWLYQICRMIKKAFKRSSPIQTLVDDYKRTKTKLDMFDCMGLEDFKIRKQID